MPVVRMGLAGQYGQDRFDVELGEADLARIQLEFGLHDLSQLSTLTVVQAETLLQLECERYIIAQSPKYGVPMTTAQQQMAKNRADFRAVLASLGVAEDLLRTVA